MRMGRKFLKRGFTLIETVVTVGIIATMAAVVIPQISKQFDAADPTRLQNDLKNLQSAVETFNVNVKVMPGDIDDLAVTRQQRDDAGEAVVVHHLFHLRVDAAKTIDGHADRFRGRGRHVARRLAGSVEPAIVDGGEKQGDRKKGENCKTRAQAKSHGSLQVPRILLLELAEGKYH